MRTDYAAPDISTEMALRQSGAVQEEFVAFTSVRSATGTADASFSFGVRASRPASGLAGDRYFATDLNWLYVYTGTAWVIVCGVKSGTNAARAAYTPNATDNGAYWWTTDTCKLWEVSGGAWVDRFVSLDATTSYEVNGVKVIGAQGAAVADASGGVTVDAEARTALNTLLARLRAHGIIAT